MNRHFIQKLKNIFLPLFLIALFAGQPFISFGQELPGESFGDGQTYNPSESILPPIGDPNSSNINLPLPGDDEIYDPIEQSILPDAILGDSSYQPDLTQDLTSTVWSQAELYYGQPDENILDGGGDSSIGISADRDLSQTLQQIQRNSIAAASASSSAQQGTNTAPGSAGACIAGQLLSTVLASTITAAINGIVNTAETAVGTAIGLLSVPVADWNVKIDTLRTKEQLQTQNAARVGTSAGVPGSINSLVNVSWDSIGYCIVNSMIDYIARSTIAWAKSGFNGNPAFIENPGKFFKEIGDIEASSFLNTLAYGVLGQSICEPFRAQIVLTIARDYLNNSGDSGYYGSGGYSVGGYSGVQGSRGSRTFGGCTLDDAKNNLRSFLNGNFSQGGWNSWLQISQVDTNNPYAVYLNLSSQLQGRISQKKTIANTELSWNKGFLSYRKCENKNMKPEDCPIVTPGNLIEDQLAKTLNLSKERLVLAEKFDQVLNVVINELINTALNKVLN